MERLISIDKLLEKKRIIGTSNYCEYEVVNVSDINSMDKITAYTKNEVKQLLSDILSQVQLLNTKGDSLDERIKYIEGKSDVGKLIQNEICRLEKEIANEG